MNDVIPSSRYLDFRKSFIKDKNFAGGVAVAFEHFGTVLSYDNDVGQNWFWRPSQNVKYIIL